MGRLRVFSYRTFDATSLTGSYQDVGAVLTAPCVEYTVHNTSDVDAILSFDDGTSNSLYVPAGENVRSAAFEPQDAEFLISKNAQIQVKQVTGAGASGDIIMNLTLED